MQVSGVGAGRATAYTMTNLFFRRHDRLYFAWQDAPVTNCLGVLHLVFAVVRFLDWNHPFDHPALLFSAGRSAEPDGARARGKKAKQEVRMEVWLDVAPSLRKTTCVLRRGSYQCLSRQAMAARGASQACRTWAALVG